MRTGLLIISMSLVAMLGACAPATAIPSPTPTRGLIAPTLPPLVMPEPIISGPIPTPTLPEPPVSFASYTFDWVRRELVQFGGTIALHCNECNPTWLLDDTTWRQVQPPTSPPGRVGPGFVFDQARGNSVLFGSPTQAGTWLNDTWVWDGLNWTEEHPSLSPSPRAGLQMVYDPDRKLVVLFGGTGPDPKNPSATIGFNETWLWDGKNWSQARPAKSPPAPAENPWAMAYDGAHHHVLLFDGAATWTWDGKAWTEQHPAHSPDAPFTGVMAYDEAQQQLVFAGTNASQAVETWLWDGSDWQQQQTKLRLNPLSQPHMYYHPGYGLLLLYVLNRDSGGVTGSALWYWKDNDWGRDY